MVQRLRDKFNLEDDAPQRAGLAGALGIPAFGEDRNVDVEEMIELVEVGSRWAALLCLGVLATLVAVSVRDGLLWTSDGARVSLWAGIAAILAGETAMATLTWWRRTEWRPVATVFAIAVAGAVGVTGWTLVLAGFAGPMSTIMVLCLGAIVLGQIAHAPLAVSFLVRVAAMAATCMVAGLATAAWLAPALTGLSLLGVLVIVARRRSHHIRARRTRQAVTHTAFSLVDAFERSGRGWFWQVDRAGHLTYISSQIADRLGRDPDELVGQPFTTLIQPAEQQTQPGDGSDHGIEFALSAGLEFHDLIVRAQSSNERWWALSGMPITDPHGRLMGFHGSGTDLTEQRKSEAEAVRAALVDGLTGLPNRVQIRSTLDELLNANSLRQPNCGLFLIDLDRFKTVNDTLGHPVGDALLRVVAQRLARVVGTGGQVGRLGGDEFQVIIPDVADRARLATLADTVISRLSLPYVIDGLDIQIGASVGIAIAPTDGTDPDELTRNADLALYAAKDAGKGVHQFFQPEMHALANDRRAIENDLREVVSRRQLHLLFQPVVDADTEAVVTFEALLRWDHPERGPVPPSLFIPIAEEIGVIGLIGDWVIRTACHEAAHWPAHIRLAVNLSPLQFTSPGLMATLVGALADSGLAPDRLELEITEGVLLNDDPSIDRTLASLRQLGVRLSLDDFGTGYASLAYLTRVDFSKIKIDRSFVRGAGDSPRRNEAIIRAIVNLAESLDMETVAEGAETLGDIDLVRSLGCSQIQGYVFGYPMPIEQVRLYAASLAPPTPDGLRRKQQREARLALLRVASLRQDAGSVPVRIRNLSANGAMVEAHSSTALSRHVTIDVSGGSSLTGEVRWRRGNRFGLRFDHPITVGDVVRRMTGTQAPAQPDNPGPADDAPAAPPASLPARSEPHLRPAATGLHRRTG